MQELIQRIGSVRPSIDSGMLRIGPRLDKGSKVEALLTGGASRALSLADAVVQLCRQDHANEALPVLRQLAEITVVLTICRSEETAGPILDSWENPSWESLWPAEGFSERARSAGFSEEIILGVGALCRDFTRANRAVIPWSHVFEANQKPGTDSSAVLGLTARLLGRVMRSLNAHWPEAFPGAEDFEA